MRDSSIVQINDLNFVIYFDTWSDNERRQCYLLQFFLEFSLQFLLAMLFRRTKKYGPTLTFFHSISFVIQLLKEDFYQISNNKTECDADWQLTFYSLHLK